MSGIQDVVGKSIGSSNPYNLVRASFDTYSKNQKKYHLLEEVKDIVQEDNYG